MMTPKDEEIVANRYRFENPVQHFEGLLGKALGRMSQHCSDEFPIFHFLRL